MNSSARSGYSEAGGLYALGLIYANHGAAINDYLLCRLKDEPNGVSYKWSCAKKYCFTLLFLTL